MYPSQPSVKTLSGFGTFTRVITRGKRHEKQPIKAFVLSSLSKRTSLHVGYSVSKKVRTAAHRNRLKRLMKEAFRAKKTDFIGQLTSGTRVEIVFMYNGNTEITPTMVQFSSIAQALSTLCSIIFVE